MDHVDGGPFQVVASGSPSHSASDRFHTLLALSTIHLMLIATSNGRQSDAERPAADRSPSDLAFSKHFILVTIFRVDLYEIVHNGYLDTGNGEALDRT